MLYDYIKIFAVLLMAVILHEYAHGWVANKLGDQTAKQAGRLTLNPFKHIDPVGSILVPFVLYKLMGFAFGWAKPVPVQFANLRHPKRDMILVAAAGPFTNIVLALLFSQFLKLDLPIALFQIAVQAVVINLILAVFNLVPIPPLDGSRILTGLLPGGAGRLYSQLEPWGMLIVLVLLNFGYLDFVWVVVDFIMRQLGIPVGHMLQ